MLSIYFRFDFLPNTGLKVENQSIFSILKGEDSKKNPIYSIIVNFNTCIHSEINMITKLTYPLIKYLYIIIYVQ